MKAEFVLLIPKIISENAGPSKIHESLDCKTSLVDLSNYAFSANAQDSKTRTKKATISIRLH